MNEISLDLDATTGTGTISWQEQLVRHERWLRTVILARSNEPQSVDEIFQEVAAAAIAQKAPLKDATKIAPWLYQLAVRQSLMYRRKLGRRRKHQQIYAERTEHVTQDNQTVDPLQYLLADERREMVRLALSKLNPRDAEMLLLKYTENWNYQMIGEHLAMSRSAVESRLHRARQKMRTELAKLNVVEPTKK